MDVSVSTGAVSGLEGSWRVEGELHRSGKEQDREVIWETRESSHDREVEERTMKPSAGGPPPNEARGGGPAVIAVIAVMASMMDSSIGRDKILVGT